MVYILEYGIVLDLGKAEEAKNGEGARAVHLAQRHATHTDMCGLYLTIPYSSYAIKQILSYKPLV